MTRSDFKLITLLAVLAGFIWFRNTSWISTVDDTAPLLIVLPLFFWIGSPWKWKEKEETISTSWIVGAIACFLVGAVLDLTVLLAISWTLLFWAWLLARIIPDPNRSLTKLMVLPPMAFPWIALDANNVGWWFRLSGTWATDRFFRLIGSDVTSEGTSLVINGLPISVDAACAGLNTLQSMLIAGVLVAYILLKDTSRYWWNLPLLVLLAWFANTLRIIILATAALVKGPSFAMGAFHTWGGWLILMLMFVLCWLLFSLQEPRTNKRI
jgi:exosortase